MPSGPSFVMPVQEQEQWLFRIQQVPSVWGLFAALVHVILALQNWASGSLLGTVWCLGTGAAFLAFSRLVRHQHHNVPAIRSAATMVRVLRMSLLIICGWVPLVPIPASWERMATKSARFVEIIPDLLFSPVEQLYSGCQLWSISLQLFAAYGVYLRMGLPDAAARAAANGSLMTAVAFALEYLVHRAYLRSLAARSRQAAMTTAAAASAAAGAASPGLKQGVEQGSRKVGSSQGPQADPGAERVQQQGCSWDEVIHGLLTPLTPASCTHHTLQTSGCTKAAGTAATQVPIPVMTAAGSSTTGSAGAAKAAKVATDIIGRVRQLVQPGAVQAQAHGCAPYQNASSVRCLQLYVKLSWVEPELLTPQILAQVPQAVHRARPDLHVRSCAVRKGCVQLVLDLVHAPGGMEDAGEQLFELDQPEHAVMQAEGGQDPSVLYHMGGGGPHPPPPPPPPQQQQAKPQEEAGPLEDAAQPAVFTLQQGPVVMPHPLQPLQQPGAGGVGGGIDPASESSIPSGYHHVAAMPPSRTPSDPILAEIAAIDWLSTLELGEQLQHGAQVLVQCGAAGHIPSNAVVARWDADQGIWHTSDVPPPVSNPPQLLSHYPPAIVLPPILPTLAPTSNDLQQQQQGIRTSGSGPLSGSSLPSQPARSSQGSQVPHPSSSPAQSGPMGLAAATVDLKEQAAHLTLSLSLIHDQASGFVAGSSDTVMQAPFGLVATPCVHLTRSSAAGDEQDDGSTCQILARCKSAYLPLHIKSVSTAPAQHTGMCTTLLAVQVAVSADVAAAAPATAMVEVWHGGLLVEAAPVLLLPQTSCRGTRGGAHGADALEAELASLSGGSRGSAGDVDVPAYAAAPCPLLSLGTARASRDVRPAAAVAAAAALPSSSKFLPDLQMWLEAVLHLRRQRELAAAGLRGRSLPDSALNVPALVSQNVSGPLRYSRSGHLRTARMLKMTQMDLVGTGLLRHAVRCGARALAAEILRHLVRPEEAPQPLSSHLQPLAVAAGAAARARSSMPDIHGSGSAPSDVAALAAAAAQHAPMRHSLDPAVNGLAGLANQGQGQEGITLSQLLGGSQVVPPRGFRPHGMAIGETTLLHLAAQSGSVGMMSDVLGWGAGRHQLCVRDAHGATPLHFAAALARQDGGALALFMLRAGGELARDTWLSSAGPGGITPQELAPWIELPAPAPMLLPAPVQPPLYGSSSQAAAGSGATAAAATPVSVAATAAAAPVVLPGSRAIAALLARPRSLQSTANSDSLAQLPSARCSLDGPSPSADKEVEGSNPGPGPTRRAFLGISRQELQLLLVTCVLGFKQPGLEATYARYAATWRLPLLTFGALIEFLFLAVFCVRCALNGSLQSDAVFAFMCGAPLPIAVGLGYFWRAQGEVAPLIMAASKSAALSLVCFGYIEAPAITKALVHYGVDAIKEFMLHVPSEQLRMPQLLWSRTMLFVGYALLYFHIGTPHPLLRSMIVSLLCVLVGTALDMGRRWMFLKTLTQQQQQQQHAQQQSALQQGAPGAGMSGCRAGEWVANGKQKQA